MAIEIQSAAPKMEVAARQYNNAGWIIHPLSNPIEGERNSGKIPIEKGWQNRETTRTDDEITKFWGNGSKEPYNIGLQCGKRSGVIVVDVDDWNPAIMNYLTEGLTAEEWLMSNRTTGRSHIFFKYTSEIKSQKHHDLGIEILSDGNNAVLPPSKHQSGTEYKFNREPATSHDIPEMPEEFIQRLNILFATNGSLNASLNKCKPCLREKFNEHRKIPNVDDWRGSNGRELTLALMADLYANGAGEEVLTLVCKYIFREWFDPEVTQKELSRIFSYFEDGGKPWTCDSIRTKLNRIVLDPEDPEKTKCEFCKFSIQSSRQHNLFQTQPVPSEETDPLDIDYDEEGLPEDVLIAAEEEAIRILKEGDPIAYIMEIIQKFHIGDEEALEAIALSIAGQSCSNTAGLHVSMNGPSGDGKSHCMKSAIKLVPARFKRETSLSAKAAYYMNLRPGMILFSDDKELNEDAEEVIKQATTNYQKNTVHQTVKEQQGKTVIIPPRINWYLTSVESTVSDQLLNRQLTFSTDSSLAQKERIFQMQQAEAKRGKMAMTEVTPEVLVCRRIYSRLKENLFEVKIPFADQIDIKDKSDSRIFTKILDMIRSYAIFKYMQREKDDEGAIIATLEDFNRAKNLFESQKESALTKLNTDERRVVQLIANKPNGADLNLISEKTGLAYEKVRRILNGRSDRKTKGLLEKVKGLTTEEITEDFDGTSKRRRTMYYLKKDNIWELYDQEFITLKCE